MYRNAERKQSSTNNNKLETSKKVRGQQQCKKNNELPDKTKGLVENRRVMNYLDYDIRIRYRELRKSIT